MKKIFLAVIFFCIAASMVYPQSKKDSLLKVLNSNPSDTTRILTLSRLAEEIRRNNPDTALFCVNEAIQLAEKSGFKKGWAAALNTKGYMLSSNYDYDGSNQLHQQALKFSNEANNPSEIARSYTGLGQVEIQRRQLNKAGDYYRLALMYNLQAGNKKAIASSYTNVAAVFGMMTKYDSCIFYQLKSIEILESLSEHGSLGRAYANLGGIFVEKEAYPEAFKYLGKALDNSRIAKDKMHQSYILNEIVRCYIALKKYDDASRCNKESMQLAIETNRKDFLLRGFQAIGTIAEAKGDYDTALTNYKQAYSIAELLKSPSDIIALDLSIAKLLNKTGKPMESLNYLQHALNIPSINQNGGELMQVYDDLQITYSILNDYKKGHYYLQLYGKIKDSLATIEQAKMVEDLKLQYETEKKDHQISLLDLQSRSKGGQRNLLILISVLLAVSLITLFFIFRQRMQISRLKEQEQARIQLQSLRNDIAHDLHDDIGSTLSSISYYSEAIRQQVKEYTPQVIPLLDKMEEASAYTVNAMSDIVWAINATHDVGANLLNRMHTYATEICGLKNISLEFETDRSFETAKLSMEARKNIYLIFKEAVNNAVKYSECKKISISLGLDGDNIVMKIGDDGKGFDSGGEFTGNGLKNIHVRAGEIKANLSITSEQGKGTLVKLSYKFTKSGD